jgi:hypothetical protein
VCGMGILPMNLHGQSNRAGFTPPSSAVHIVTGRGRWPGRCGEVGSPAKPAPPV